MRRPASAVSRDPIRTDQPSKHRTPAQPTARRGWITSLLGAVATVVMSLAVVAGVQVGPAEAHADGTASPAALAASNCDDNGADQHFSREEVLRRARSWLKDNNTFHDPNDNRSDGIDDSVNYLGEVVGYTQGECHTNGYGSYRRDCSGFVAMAWGLGGSGGYWWTGNLRPSESAGHTVEIPQNQLAPGDALLRHEGNTHVDHVALFVRWQGTGALVYEQTSDGDRVRSRVWPMSRINQYEPIRYTGLAPTLVPGGDGYLNLVRQYNGEDVDWYYHRGWRNGTSDWGVSHRLGNGFNGLEKVVAVSGSELLGIFPDGTMRWYGAVSDETWASNTGTVVGTGWNQFKFVVAGGNGTVYGVDYDGTLKWYKWNGINSRWATGSGKQIGSGWQPFRYLTGYNGVFYAVKHTGELDWYRYTTPDDGRLGQSDGWARNSGMAIGSGWAGGGCAYQTVAAEGEGVLYAVNASGGLKWQHHLDPTNGAPSWSPVSSCGNTVGSGWG